MTANVVLLNVTVYADPRDKNLTVERIDVEADPRIPNERVVRILTDLASELATNPLEPVDPKWGGTP